jgi:glutamate-5-semialdehyde dehydrogenase
MTNNKNLKNMVEKVSKSKAIISESQSSQRSKVILNLAENIEKNVALILAANQQDKEIAKKENYSPVLLDRLTLNQGRIADLARSLKEVATLNDPLGAIEDFKTLPSGLTVGKLRIPLGLILFICEARPGAVVEAAAMAIKSGNAIIIKPGKEAAHTAKALAPLISQALISEELSENLAVVDPTINREDLTELLKLDDLVDLVIPRGGEGLIRFVSENSRIPVLKHYKGVCHLFVDKAADLLMAQELTINSKTSRPATCNSLECLLVHQDVAEKFLPSMGKTLSNLGVTLEAEVLAQKYLPQAKLIEENEFGREYLNMTLAVKVVKSLLEAIEHIRKHGSNHTESIVTTNLTRAGRFLRLVDASCVMINASTRLNDGGCLGLGAEIGISTSKLHAYGPMGLRELTTTKFIVFGEGHLRK